MIDVRKETGPALAHWKAMILTGLLLGAIAAFALGETPRVR